LSPILNASQINDSFLNQRIETRCYNTIHSYINGLKSVATTLFVPTSTD
jgi:hypothetical protein